MRERERRVWAGFAAFVVTGGGTLLTVLQFVGMERPPVPMWLIWAVGGAITIAATWWAASGEGPAASGRGLREVVTSLLTVATMASDSPWETSATVYLPGLEGPYAAHHVDNPGVPLAPSPAAVRATTKSVDYDGLPFAAALAATMEDGRQRAEDLSGQEEPWRGTVVITAIPDPENDGRSMGALVVWCARPYEECHLFEGRFLDMDIVVAGVLARLLTDEEWHWRR
jgi:hypothetical protein